MSEPGEAAAMQDITNKMSNFSIDSKRVEEAGWNKPEPYNYEALGAPPNKREVDGVKLEEFAGTAAKYEWKDDFGDVGPEHPELEKMLFGDDSRIRKGEDYKKIDALEVTFESETTIQKIKKFEDAGLHPIMLDNVRKSGYDAPTPIQTLVLPAVFKNKDVIGIAQTGSGKTAAYLIPVLSKLMGKAKRLAAPRPYVTEAWTHQQGVRAEPLVLVIVPTRELALQVFDECRRLCYRSMLRPCVVYGGAPTMDQIDDLRKGCDILAATPGRLIDFLNRGNLLSLRRLKYTILDEADELVSEDWQEDMKRIMGGDASSDDDHLYMMFSATFSKHARALAREYLSSDHVRVHVGRAGSSHECIRQQIIMVEEDMKQQAITDKLLSLPAARTIIFVNGKFAADKLDAHLYQQGFPSTSIHADRTQREREDSIRSFKKGRAPILVATGISARGLDIKNVLHVINYDLPSTDYGGIDEYVHRIGRTARLGNPGLATSFYNERNEDIAEGLTKILAENKQEIPDFLEPYKPQDASAIDFGDDSDDEKSDNNGDAAADTNAGRWGAGASDGWAQPTKNEEKSEANTNTGGWGAGSADAWSQPTKKDEKAEANATGWGSGSGNAW